MPEPLPYRTPDPHEQEQARNLTYLKALAIGHYVWGGMLLLWGFATIPWIIYEAPLFDPAFTRLARFSVGCVGLIYWVMGALTIYSGRCLQTRRRQMLSLVVAACNLILVPFGTILGVFTLIVASRQSVSQMYQPPLPHPR